MHALRVSLYGVVAGLVGGFAGKLIVANDSPRRGSSVVAAMIVAAVVLTVHYIGTAPRHQHRSV